MIERCKSAKKINCLINHEDILASGPQFDVAQYVTENNYFMVGDGCLFGFYDQGNSTFDVHIGVIKEKRGASAMSDFKDAVRYIFDKTGCLRLSGFVPVKNAAARKFGRLVGFRPNGVTLQRFVDGNYYMCENFILDREVA